MMKLTRLNGDSSWLLKLDGLNILIDPWLMGEQTDFATWFSTQTHRESCVHLRNLPHIDIILVSLPYTDHCHQSTLSRFSRDTCIVATPKAAGKIRKWNLFDRVEPLFNLRPHSCKEIEFELIDQGPLLDTVHRGIMIRGKNQTVLYAPHGLKGIRRMKDERVDLLLSTTTSYQLPLFLGGTINLGLQNATQLVKKFKPTYFVPSHDEDKHAKGLVSRLATTTYATLDEMKATLTDTQVVKPEIHQEIELA
jgi:L-ascorbate metabolism protein UlaG (beta-lactamase superfamily)